MKDVQGLFPQIPLGTVYADWTGSAIPPISLIDMHHHLLRTTMLGNPHSHHSSSTRAMEKVTGARRAVLQFFNADPGEYDVIWTSGASAAILLLQHMMLEGGELLLTADNHNTVNGLREIARRQGAVVRYSPLNTDLSLNAEALGKMLRNPRSNHNRLFAFPAKSNYSGVLHPLDWIQVAHSNGWDVLLDAAAYCSNDRLDLSVVKPDFVPISFYKLFGFPTGVGCLIIRKEVYQKFNKRWFSGGTILLVSVRRDFFAPESLGYARFEDGSVNFAMIPAVTAGLEFHHGLGDIKSHTTGLATDLYNRLGQVRHGGNSVMIHSPRGSDIVTFSVLKDGAVVNAWEVEKAADAAQIQMRTGCFCNPGVNETVFGYEVGALEAMYNDAVRTEDLTLETLRSHSGGKPIGAVRASFGYANTTGDVDRIVNFFSSYLGTL